MYTLVIGNRNYSSWSLRAWLALKHSGAAFEVVRVPLFTDEWITQIQRYSPAGRVPVLIDGDLHIWDSSAIIEHLREKAPGAVGWPEDPARRALARSVSGEMHSGFIAIRDELPQNLRARTTLDPATLSASCRDQIARIDAIWSQCYEQYDGPWLFGEFCIADIMYLPVALRFVTYGIQVSDGARRFVDAVLACSTTVEWIQGAREESEALDFIDNLTPATDSPLTLG
ncbi:MAG: glutathione S-transferase family protein [Pseudomonadota bacterium]